MSILGHHSAGELRDWLAAMDYQVAQIAKAYAAFAPTWKAQNAQALADWTHDWNEFQSRYGVAHALARMAIVKATLTPVPDSLIPVEDEWQRVHNALTQSPGTISKGDLQDLYNRLAAARGTPIDMPKTPQPTAADADLHVFKAADAVAKGAEDLTHHLPPPPDTSTKILIGGGIALGLALVVRSILR